MRRTVQQLKEKVTLFDELRTAMRIALPESNQGLNDDGIDCDMKTMKEKVSVFREQLAKKIETQGWPDRVYRKMLKQIDKYWDKLFADPILVETAGSSIMIQPQRTNNILERFFQDFKRMGRKKSGSKFISKTLRVMLADTPLVKNLSNEGYMGAILNGAPDLQTRFSQIDSARVREKLRESSINPEKIPAPIKKVIRAPWLLSKIVPKSDMRWALNAKSNQPLPS